jgi:hypothetical protein
MNPNYAHEEVSGNSSESNVDTNKHGKAEKETKDSCDCCRKTTTRVRPLRCTYQGIMKKTKNSSLKTKSFKLSDHNGCNSNANGYCSKPENLIIFLL